MACLWSASDSEGTHVRSRLPMSAAVTALVASAALVPVASPALAATPVEVASDLDGSPSNLVSFATDAPAFGSSGDGFEVFQRDVSPTIPFSLLDDSLSIFPPDSLGIVGEDETGRFFGATDTENGDNAGPVTATWTFDVAAADGPLFLNVAAGAMGDFEGNDAFAFAAEPRRARGD